MLHHVKTEGKLFGRENIRGAISGDMSMGKCPEALATFAQQYNRRATRAFQQAGVVRKMSGAQSICNAIISLRKMLPAPPPSAAFSRRPMTSLQLCSADVTEPRGLVLSNSCIKQYRGNRKWPALNRYR